MISQNHQGNNRQQNELDLLLDKTTLSGKTFKSSRKSGHYISRVEKILDTEPSFAHTQTH